MSKDLPTNKTNCCTNSHQARARRTTETIPCAEVSRLRPIVDGHRGQKDWWAKRLVGKKIGGQKDWWAKRLVGKKIGGQKDRWAKRSVGKKIGGQKDRWAKRSVGKKIGGQKDRWAKRSVGKKIDGQKDRWAKMRCCSGSMASGQMT